jgi:hypothetical protein
MIKREPPREMAHTTERLCLALAAVWGLMLGVLTLAAIGAH